jgi:predicted transcriptional regulator
MKDFAEEPRGSALGHLEESIMRVLWSQGEKNVRDVVEQLERPLAYTTVMTTLDRLFKKGLLHRRKEGRAFFYTASMTQEEFRRKRMGELVSDFLGGQDSSQEMLVSCLVDAVSDHDEGLLDELERKIKLRREELARKAML